MRFRSLLKTITLGPLVLAGCPDGTRAEASADPAVRDGAAPSELETPDVGPASEDGGVDAVPPRPRLVKVPVVAEAVIAGALSLAADEAGDVSLAWLDTPSTQRHLHIALIAGAENPPRVKVLSDSPLDSGVHSVGQAVSSFVPSKGCFAVVWGQGGDLRMAGVGADAKPGPSSVLTTIASGALDRLSQVRTASDGAGQTLVAWSEVARYSSDAAGTFRSATIGFSDCAPGLAKVDPQPFSGDALSYQAPPAGAPEIAVARSSGGFAAAFQQRGAGAILGVAHRRRTGTTWDAPTEIDDGATVTAGGSVALAATGDGVTAAYYRRTSDTVGDLVVASISADGRRTGENVLEHGVLTGMSSATQLEAARLAIASGPEGRAVIVAAFARDGATSELRVYRADAAASGGFRSELIDTAVFGPRGSADAAPLVDVAVDKASRIHVAWRSGASRSVTYARLVP